MTAFSVSGVGQGSALKAGQKQADSFYAGVEKLIGVRVIYAESVTMSGSTTSVTFPVALPGLASDYVVFANGPHASYASALTINGFTMNGTSPDVVNYLVVRTNNATVQKG